MLFMELVFIHTTTTSTICRSRHAFTPTGFIIRHALFTPSPLIAAFRPLITMPPIAACLIPDSFSDMSYYAAAIDITLLRRR